MRLQTSERADIADGPGDSRSKVSPPIARLVSENPLREPWIFVEGEDPTKDHYRKLTDKEWVKWRNEDPESFDDRYELCEEGPAMYKKRSSTSSRKTPREEAPQQEPIDWDEVEGEERSETFRQQFVGKDGTKPFDYTGRDMERRKFFPTRDADHPAYTVPNLSLRQQAVIGGLLSLSRVPTSEVGTESDRDTVKLPRESALIQCATLWGASTWPCWRNLDPRSLRKGENKRKEPVQHPRKKDQRLWRSENWRPCYKTDWHYVRRPLNQTEGDSDIDIMDRPPLIVSQEAAKACRLPIKHRMEDQARGTQGDASKGTAPPSQQRAKVVRRLATPLEKTPVARVGQPGRAFMDSGNRADTIWSPGGSATTAAIGLTKMMTLPKKSESPRITT